MRSLNLECGTELRSAEFRRPEFRRGLPGPKLDMLYSSEDTVPADAREELLDEYARRLRFVCVKRGVPVDDAEDLTHDVLLAATLQLRSDRFRGESRFGTWIMAIALNKIAEYWRSRQRAGAVIVTSIDHCDPEYGRLVMSLAGPPMARDGTSSFEVEDLLQRLPGEHRFILLLNAIGGYTTGEIARLLGRSSSRTGVLLAEAKQRFRLLHREAAPKKSRVLQRRVE